MKLRRGITTGVCAAVAAKAAATVLAGGDAPREVELRLPAGEMIRVPVLYVRSHLDCHTTIEQMLAGTATKIVWAAVRKDAGDDPDVTHGLEVRVKLTWDDTAWQAARASRLRLSRRGGCSYHGIRLVAGAGVGIVTKPGLQVPPGEPAINPVPRAMILAAIREVTARGVRVEISIPGDIDTKNVRYQNIMGYMSELCENLLAKIKQINAGEKNE